MCELARLGPFSNSAVLRNIIIHAGTRNSEWWTCEISEVRWHL